MKQTLYILVLIILLLLPAHLSAQEKASPKQGEGISTFLLRHNRSPKKYYDDFLKLNATKLGKDRSLKLGVVYLIPQAKRKQVIGKANQTDADAVVDATPLLPNRSTKEEEDSLNKEERGKADEVVNFGKRTRRGGAVNEPLYGASLANVKVTSNRLAGACFYVVSGHGGPDPGAVGKVGRYELHEDEYAYDIALRLARDLMQEGAEVYIIIQDAKDGIREDAYLPNSKRETCMSDPIPLNQVRRLQQRCDKINELYRKNRKQYNYCRAIFIHVDSRSKGQQTDVFFYHSQRKTESKRLAYAMKDTFEAKYGKHQPNRGFSGTVSGRNLYVLAHTTPVSVFVELGNIQNSFDQRRLVMPSNRQALANWLFEGFLNDFRKR